MAPDAGATCVPDSAPRGGAPSGLQDTRISAIRAMTGDPWSCRFLQASVRYRPELNWRSIAESSDCRAS